MERAREKAQVFIPKTLKCEGCKEKMTESNEDPCWDPFINFVRAVKYVIKRCKNVLISFLSKIT